MSETESTYSVELVGFSEADAEQAVTHVAEVFGLPLDKARALVAKAPVFVKRGADGANAKRVTKALLRMGARVRIHDERTGKVQAYKPKAHPAAEPPPPPSVPVSVPAVRVDPVKAAIAERAAAEKLASERAAAEAAAVTADAPPVEVDETPAYAPSADMLLALRRLGLSDEDEAPRSRRGGEELADDDLEDDDEDEDEDEDDEDHEDDDEASAPGDAGPAEPSLAVEGRRCAACRSPLPRGRTCGACGFDQVAGDRYCPTCRLPIVPTTGTRLRVRLVRALVLFLVPMGVVVESTVLGPLAAATSVVVVAAIVVGVLRLGVAHRCKQCDRETVVEHLSPKERHAGDRWRASLGGATAALVVLAAVLGVLFFRRPVLDVRTAAGHWSAKLPVTHRDLASSSANVPTPWGPAAPVAFAYAFNSQLPMSLYGVVSLEVPASVRELVEVSPDDLDALLHASASLLFKGNLVGYPANTSFGAERGRGSRFTGRFQGQSISGELRAKAYGRAVVMLVVAGEPAVGRTLDGSEFFDTLSAGR